MHFILCQLRVVIGSFDECSILTLQVMTITKGSNTLPTTLRARYIRLIAKDDIGCLSLDIHACNAPGKLCHHGSNTIQIILLNKLYASSVRKCYFHSIFIPYYPPKCKTDFMS